MRKSDPRKDFYWDPDCPALFDWHMKGEHVMRLPEWVSPEAQVKMTEDAARDEPMRPAPGSLLPTAPGADGGDVIDVDTEEDGDGDADGDAVIPFSFPVLPSCW